MADGEEEESREWEILLTAEVEAFLDDLYESDRVTHQLVNQADLGSGTQWSFGRPPTGGLGYGLKDRQHEGATSAVGRAK